MRGWRFAGAILASLLGALPAGGALAQGRPLIVYVSPNPIGVNDFLKLGRVGTEAVARTLGAEAKVFESTDPTTQRQNVEAAARAGAKIVITVGFEFNDLVPDIAARYPAVKFLMVDSCAKTLHPNMYCATFREYEPSFLAGAEAAWTSRSGKVGSVGALDIPFLHRFTDAFGEGAKYARADITVVPTLWVGGSNAFSDPARGAQRGAAMTAAGADRVFAAASGSNGGIFKAMRDAPGALAFGVDVNQCPQAPGAVIDNVEKRTDVVVEQSVAGIFHGTEPQMATLGLKEGGMTLTGLGADVAASQCAIAQWPAVITKLKALREEIVSGAIRIADPLMK
ncbi:MAG: BMP family ABC transporter substrate-binding protein [Alphaproteobacteria bacterium]|nr:BMP family ABC transporter substrate-binding protein [Alphaproteobacteria bacterium]